MVRPWKLNNVTEVGLRIGWNLFGLFFELVDDSLGELRRFIELVRFVVEVAESLREYKTLLVQRNCFL